MDKIIVTILGILGAILTYWFFLGKSGKRTAVQEKSNQHHGHH
jgi:hypothetical protein